MRQLFCQPLGIRSILLHSLGNRKRLPYIYLQLFVLCWKQNSYCCVCLSFFFFEYLWSIIVVTFGSYVLIGILLLIYCLWCYYVFKWPALKKTTIVIGTNKLGANVKVISIMYVWKPNTAGHFWIISLTFQQYWCIWFN